MKKLRLLILVIGIMLVFASCQAKDETNGKGEVPGSDTVSTEPNNSESDSPDTTDPDVTPETEPIEPFDYMANDLSSMVKIANYKTFTVNRSASALTDEEFENEISALLDKYSYYDEITDRAVAEGDTVVSDFSGFYNGVQFEGGTATDQEIVVSPDTGYVTGFAEAYIGQMPGVEFSFDVTFPKDYRNTELAGNEVTFICTVKYIKGETKIVPELTDEFVKEKFDYDSADEFRTAYRKEAEGYKNYYTDSMMHSHLWSQIVENSEIIMYPPNEIDRVYNEYKTLYEQRAAYYGTDYDTYINNYAGITDIQLHQECENLVKEDIIMYYLVKENNLELTEDEYTAGLDYLAGYYTATVDEMVAQFGEESLRVAILWDKLMTFVSESVTIVQE